jgi:DNA-binding IclR family transcriptional regulator
MVKTKLSAALDIALPEDEESSASTRMDTTLVKGLSVLIALAESNSPLGVSTLSSELGYGKSNIHRLLNTLLEMGFVTQEEDTRRYKATLKLWELGSVVIDRHMLRRAAKQTIGDISLETGNSVFVTTLSGTDILYIEKAESIRGPRSSTRAGLRVPAAFTAAGKVLLAHQRDPIALLDHIIKTVPNASTLDRDALIEEFEEIRSTGYAISRGGWTRGFNSVAVVIPQLQGPNEQGYPHSALGMASTDEFLSTENPREAVRILTEGARRIAELLGPSDVFVP